MSQSNPFNESIFEDDGMNNEIDSHQLQMLLLENLKNNNNKDHSPKQQSELDLLHHHHHHHNRHHSHQNSKTSTTAAAAAAAAAATATANADDSNADGKLGGTVKKCNCKQSQCIKLYCECYAAGVYCNGCHCVGCKNNYHSEGWRNRAIQNTLVKNPTAFLPKITQKPEASKVVDSLNLGKHSKGCACKRSGCMKKYCECFQAGVPCSENCKCSDCQNIGYASSGNLLRQFREESEQPVANIPSSNNITNNNNNSVTTNNPTNSTVTNNISSNNNNTANNTNNNNNTSSSNNNNNNTATTTTSNNNSQLLHKFLLAQNEDHLNTILVDAEHELVVQQQHGIPINQKFLDESCLKLLQILHWTEDTVFNKRDELLGKAVLMKENGCQTPQAAQHTGGVEKMVDEGEDESRADGFAQRKESAGGQQLGLEIEEPKEWGSSLGAISMNVVTTTQYANNGKSMEDEEKKESMNAQEGLHEKEKEDSMECEEEADELMNSAAVAVAAASGRLGLVNGDHAEEVADSIVKLEAVSKQDEVGEEQAAQQRGVNSAVTAGQKSAALGAMNSIESQVNGQMRASQNGFAAAGMELESHSTEITRNQELFELRRNFILDTFLGLLRNIEAQI